METTTIVKPNSSISAQIQATVSAVLDILTNVLGRKSVGRPCKRGIEQRNHVSMVADAERELYSSGSAVIGYLAAAGLREDNTDEDRAMIARSEEATYQGLLPCGDPAQSELFIQTHIRLNNDDTEGKAFRREAKRALGMLRYAVQQEHEERLRRASLPVTDEEYAPYSEPVAKLRYVRNIVTRAERNGEGKAQRSKTRARYGGRLYGSDRLQDREGEVTLAIVTPNKGRTILATFEKVLDF